MSNSIRSLVQKTKYNSVNAQQEINNIIATSKPTGLFGFNKEPIVYNETEEIKNYLQYINNNIDKVTKTNSKEIVLLDSYSSATIEGAKTTIEEVRKAVNSKNKSISQKMVLNTIAGNNFAIKNGIREENLRTLWEIIVKDVCENVNVKGDNYRSGQVYVATPTGTIIHTPCVAEKIPQFMSYLHNYCYSNILLDVCIIHFYFVYIHPFCDGNGRTARTWLYSDLIRYYNQKFKYLSISTEILKNVNTYYKTLTESEFVYANQINITTFIEFLLESMCNAIERGKANHIVFTDIERYILEKVSRDGITVKNLTNKQYSESSIRNALANLIAKNIMYRTKEDNKYRYYKYYN